jgi:hypothetical protein
VLAVRRRCMCTCCQSVYRSNLPRSVVRIYFGASASSLYAGFTCTSLGLQYLLYLLRVPKDLEAHAESKSCLPCFHDPRLKSNACDPAAVSAYRHEGTYTSPGSPLLVACAEILSSALRGPPLPRLPACFIALALIVIHLRDERRR